MSPDETQPEQVEQAATEPSRIAGVSTSNILAQLDDFCVQSSRLFHTDGVASIQRSLHCRTIIGRATQAAREIEEENMATMNTAHVTDMQRQKNENMSISSSTHGVDLQQVLSDLASGNRQIKSQLTELDRILDRQHGQDDRLLQELENIRKSLREQHPHPDFDDRFMQCISLTETTLALEDRINDPNTPRAERLEAEQQLVEVNRRLSQVFAGNENIASILQTLKGVLKKHRVETGKNVIAALPAIKAIQEQRTIQQHQNLHSKVTEIRENLERIARSAELSIKPSKTEKFSPE